MVRPDQVSLGVLVRAVPRDAVDDAVAACGVREKRSDGKLPAHVIAYLTLALCLFPDDDYARGRDQGHRVAGPVGLLERRLDGADRRRRSPRPVNGWAAEVFAELFEQRAARSPARPTARWWRWAPRGGVPARWRLLAIDGFEIDVPDTEANAAEFGYAGSGENRSAFPKARVVALAECGTHAFVAAEVGA